MDGFKTSERKGVTVSPGERAAVGTITIEVGALSETVTVTGAAPMIQAQTGDRSFVVTDGVGRKPARGEPQLRGVRPVDARRRHVTTSATGADGRAGGRRADELPAGRRGDGGHGREPAGRWRSIRTRSPKCASSRRRTRRSTAARAASRSWASPRAARTSSGDRSSTWSGGRPGTRTPGRTCRTAIAKPNSNQTDWGVHDRRAGRQTRRQEQAVLLLLRADVAPHLGRCHQPLPGADGARAARATSRRAST